MIGRCPEGPTRFPIPWTNGMPREFILTALTSDPAMIRAADAAGVNRIGLDIERLGKAHRQGHIPGARISDQRLEELGTVAAHVRHAEVFIRVNPIHLGSREEIEEALALGARAVMLPQFTTAREVEMFVRILGGRASAVLLLETAAGIVNLRDIVAVDGISEIMVGLNDLHLALGMSSHFEVVSSDVIRRISGVVLEAGRRFGFGGVARVDDGSLPVPPDLVIAQYPRLGATAAWLSRSFFHGIGTDDLGPAVLALRLRMAYWETQSAAALERKREELEQHLECRELVRV